MNTMSIILTICLGVSIILNLYLATKIVNTSKNRNSNVPTSANRLCPSFLTDYWYSLISIAVLITFAPTIFIPLLCEQKYLSPFPNHFGYLGLFITIIVAIMDVSFIIVLKRKLDSVQQSFVVSSIVFAVINMLYGAVCAVYFYYLYGVISLIAAALPIIVFVPFLVGVFYYRTAFLSHAAKNSAGVFSATIQPKGRKVIRVSVKSKNTSTSSAIITSNENYEKLSVFAAETSRQIQKPAKKAAEAQTTVAETLPPVVEESYFDKQLKSCGMKVAWMHTLEFMWYFLMLIPLILGTTCWDILAASFPLLPGASISLEFASGYHTISMLQGAMNLFFIFTLRGKLKELDRSFLTRGATYIVLNILFSIINTFIMASLIGAPAIIGLLIPIAAYVPNVVYFYRRKILFK